MDDRKINVNINKKTLLVIRDLFLHISEEGDLKEPITQPNLNFIFVGDVSASDQRMPVAYDERGVVMFVKTVPMKSKIHKEVVYTQAYYCIAKRKCSYIHYHYHKIMQDDLYELYLVDPKYVNECCIFEHEGEEVKLEGDISREVFDSLECFDRETKKKMEKSISALASMEHNDAFRRLGYYIDTGNYNSIHCFQKAGQRYIKNVKPYTTKDVINKNGKETLEEHEIHRAITNIISGDIRGELVTRIKLCENEQEIVLEISKFICQFLIVFFFDI